VRRIASFGSGGFIKLCSAIRNSGSLAASRPDATIPAATATAPASIPLRGGTPGGVGVYCL